MFSLKAKQNKNGEIQVIIGPIFSGKSTELNLRIQRHKIAQKRCLVIDEAKHSKSQSDQTKRGALESYLDVADQYDVIAIDDGHCYDTIVTFCNKMADKGKTMIVAARDSTHLKKGYTDILTLISLAERVDKLSAICVHCSQNASFTCLVDSESQFQVKDDDSNLSKHYEPVCRGCFWCPHQSVTPKCFTSIHQSISPNSPLKENLKENVKPLQECPTFENPNVAKIAASGPDQDENFTPPLLTKFKNTVNRTKLFSSP